MTDEIELELKWREYQDEVNSGGTNMTFEHWCMARTMAKAYETGTIVYKDIVYPNTPDTRRETLKEVGDAIRGINAKAGDLRVFERMILELAESLIKGKML